MPAYSESSGFVWIIEPELEYDRIYYCGICNLFGEEPRGNINTASVGHDPDLSNVKTHLIEFSRYYDDNSAYVCVGHGFSTNQYFYDDEKKEIFVIYSAGDSGAQLNHYTLNEFKEHFPVFFFESCLIPIRKVDSEKIEMDESWSLDYTYIGDKYALMYGDEFITGYIYDDYKSRGNRYSVNDLIDMQLNGKWGIIDKNGNAVMPFVFEDIEFINDDAAFVKYEGKYGVLDVKSTIFAFVSSPTTSDGVSVYIFVVLLTFVFFMLGFTSRKSKRIL